MSKSITMLPEPLPYEGPYTLILEHPQRLHEEFAASNLEHNNMRVLEVIDLGDGWLRVAYEHPGWSQLSSQSSPSSSPQMPG